MKRKKQRQQQQQINNNVFDVWTRFDFNDGSYIISINPFLPDNTPDKKTFINILLSSIPINQKSKLNHLLYVPVLPDNYKLPDWMQKYEHINYLNGVQV